MVRFKGEDIALSAVILIIAGCLWLSVNALHNKEVGLSDYIAVSKLDCPVDKRNYLTDGILTYKNKSRLRRDCDRLMINKVKGEL